MDDDSIQRTAVMVELTLSHDKHRGIVIEKIATENDEYFFKYGDQPIHRHCEQIQRIVRAAKVIRSKKILVDIAEFSYEYFRDNEVTFKGCRLNSIGQQMNKVCNLYINKEIGAMKRRITVAQNKTQKIQEYNDRIASNMQAMNDHYQRKRAERMQELFGSQTAPTGTVSVQAPSSTQYSANPANTQSPLQHQVDPNGDIVMNYPDHPSDGSDF